MKQSTQNQQAPTPDIKSVPLSAVNSTSRLLWSRDSIRGGRTQTLTESDVSKNLCDSMERSSRLAKYNKYPIVHSGRTSVMVSTIIIIFSNIKLCFISGCKGDIKSGVTISSRTY